MPFHRTVSLALLIPINQGLFKDEQTPVVRRVDNAIHRISYYPLDSVIGYRNTYPLDSDLSGG